MPEITFEDIEPGTTETFGPVLADREEMIAFARAFDDQPFHLTETAARTTGVGRLIASGWYNSGLQMRLLARHWFGRSSCLAGLGIERQSWLKPVAPGDRLTVRRTIVDTRLSAGRPDAGIVRFDCDLGNQDGQVVMQTRQAVLFGRRGAPMVPLSPPPPCPDTPPSRGGGVEDPEAAPRCFEEIEIGRAVDLGTYDFTEARIVDFARLYDPQSFHLSREGGAAGPFGALAASGWHTAAGWMHLYSARLRRIAEAGRAPRASVSPGYGDLRWRRPVYVGDVIRFASEPVAKRPLASRPGWGLVTSRNTGWNARGETVIEFTGSAFWTMGWNEGAVLTAKT
ncbi:MaoC/PaaZ C-terminal domain-containing protein [Enterovirga rhinocerotis]|uniref:Acyl dehydratase n=1 Tax=Enterovirga rhinocerotis TaxID=1339210 RepID=A0A4R7CDL5_9HYPH|nr:MaoC/PaaZ C-terminal domain-containing protein [Enterovirga rhinocerotis]TDR94927.1 acyl dehydratase [Enterovirga rhinocerotis]